MQPRISRHVEHEIAIRAGPDRLHGLLRVPADALGIVLFAHGSGSSRRSPRNVFVADALHARGLGTLLFDLLTPDEEQADRHTREHRFDIPLLAGRLVQATNWVDAEPGLRGLPAGYFGASTGSAAALMAAASLGRRIGAVVSRGGRPDLVKTEQLQNVTAATLLVVGGSDEVVIDLNQLAFEQLRCVKELHIVPRASHLFEEPGTLEAVAELAADWFSRHLAREARTASAGLTIDPAIHHAVE
jgi:predicted alpha/beta-hydrolase family hydrolase